MPQFFVGDYGQLIRYRLVRPNGTPFDLTNCEVTLIFSLQGGAPISKIGVVETPTTLGEIHYCIEQGLLAYPGRYGIRIKVTIEDVLVAQSQDYIRVAL